MNKPIAPKDMTVEAFIDLVEKRNHSIKPMNMNAWINTLRMIAEEPAPNPFTADQLAWMRQEQKSGFLFAWSDAKGYIWCSVAKPSEKVIETGGWECAGCHGAGMGTFLRWHLHPDDPEPLCFADYAPLEGAAEAALAGKGE
ncbi:MAG: hypothetical protein EOM03_14410 [Clostridia bacterium]|nr:hypothetical protein [Clostridia bacterium]